MSKTMKRAVIFDCDGVLINSEEVGYHIVKAFLERHDIHYSRAEYVELLSGVSYREFQRKVRAAFRARTGGDLPDNFESEISRLLKESIDTQVKAIHGVKELLGALRRAGIPYAVASNSRRENLVHKLKITGLYDDFAPHIYSADDVENPKPAPDLPLLAAKKLGIPPEECIAVEDSVTGTLGFVNAGIATIGFIGEAHRDDGEGQYLLRAGACTLAYGMKQVGICIGRMTGKWQPAIRTPKPPSP